MTARDNSIIDLIPVLPIPTHLTGEVQSKLAYVDEAIARAEVSPNGERVRLYLTPAGIQQWSKAPSSRRCRCWKII